MELDFNTLLAEFYQKKPVFFNEADMVNQFARFFASKYRGTDIHMEVYFQMPACVSGVIQNVSISYDLVIVINRRVIAIEMKYKTKERSILHDRITYHLKNHNSQNLTRYDVWYDLERCEFILTQNIPLINRQPTEAYVLMYTNDHLLWGGADNNMSSDLQLSEGRYPSQERWLHAPGNINELPAEGSVGKFRLNHRIHVTNGYDFKWKDSEYGFRYLLIRAQPRVEG